LKFEVFNARSIKNKLHDLHCLLSVTKSDVICITETWLNSTLPDYLIINNNSYCVFRKDRIASKVGGGVCILTRNGIVNAVLVSLPAKYANLEMCVIDIFTESCTIRLFNCYRAPSTNRFTESINYIKDMCTCITELTPHNHSVLIVGDFNFPSLDWTADNCLKCSDVSCTGLFLNMYYSLGLSQFVTESTHGNTILDLVFSNDNNCIGDVQVCNPFSTSDHNTIKFDVLTSSLPANDTNVRPTYYDFNHADWDSITAFLDNIDFDSLFSSNQSAEYIFEKFYSILYECINRYVPLRVLRKNNSCFKYPPFIGRKLRKKAAAWRLYRQFRTPQLRSAYNKLAADCRLAIRSYVAKQEERLIDNGNVGAFYRYANNKFSFKSAIGALKNTNGNIINDPLLKAELLHNAFSNKFIHDNGIIPPSDAPTNDSKLNNIVFSPLLVQRVIKRLKIKTKGGPDGIPPIFLKKCARQLSSPLANLFSCSIDSSFLPLDWLRAYITPLFKKGSRHEPENYRPIALTATMCKLMESIIKDQLLGFLLRKGIINKNQHGFISNHSTCTNLLECTYDWLVTLNSSRTTDIIYIDFSRAFDSIVHKKLLNKLENYGITGKLLNWISCFIEDRYQCVAIENCFSSVAKVISGVPQGSVLGPILFIIFINDIDCVCHGKTNLKLFADDAKLYSEIDLSCHSSSLQSSLNNLATWAEAWQLLINVQKCFVLSTVSSKRTNVSSSRSYYLNGVLLTNSASVLDLGITISPDLSYTAHINNIVSKAFQRSSIFFRGFASRNLQLMRKAFVTYIRPILEYNCILWSPNLVYLIDLIESVQRKFTKRIPSLSNLPYSSRITSLKLQTLELRRLHFDLTNYFKILNGMSSLNPSDYFLIYNPIISTRSAVPSLLKPLHASSKLSSFFSYRSVEAWNHLPTSVKLLTSLPSFKASIKSVNFSALLKCSFL
jgi:hypothetical protein